MHNPIDSRQLAHFCALVDAGNMRKAAKQLNLTTSAISHSLKRLESDLGCALFDRNARSLTLTYAGQRLHVAAGDLLGRLNNTRYLVQKWSDTKQQTLKVGATPLASQYIIPDALREFKDNFPKMSIQVTINSSYALKEAIEEEKIDVAIIPWEYTAKQNCTVIGSDELEFIVSPQHTWAKSGASQPNLIEFERLILPSTQGYLFKLIEGYFKAYGQKTILPYVEISSEEAIKRLVELDVGVGILPSWISQKEKESGRLVGLPLGRKKLTRSWVILQQDGKEPGFPETVFQNIVARIAAKLFACPAAPSKLTDSA